MANFSCSKFYQVLPQEKRWELSTVNCLKNGFRQMKFATPTFNSSTVSFVVVMKIGLAQNTYFRAPFFHCRLSTVDYPTNRLTD